jgi:hypothetical protein
MIIHTHIRKPKKRKMTAKTRQLQKEWNELLEKYGADKKPPKKTFTPLQPQNTFRRIDSDNSHIPSVDSGTGNGFRKATNQYTGEAMIGIGTLHKSNAVPIFNEQEAKDQASMRR